MTNSIYLVLDMQNDLVAADGANGSSSLGSQVRERNILALTDQAIRKARAADVRIGFVRVGFSADYRECPKSSPVFSGAPKTGLFKLGTPGTEIHKSLSQHPDDIQIIKHRVSPFFSTSLMVTLRALDISRIYCSGVSTQAVVQATVRDGHDRDFEMIVLEDCCAAHTAEEHANSIQSLGRFGKILKSTDVEFTD